MIGIRDLILQSWKFLETIPTNKVNLAVREVDELSSLIPGLLIGSDSDDYKRILIPIQEDGKVEDATSAGIKLKTVQISDGDCEKRYLDVYCTRPNLSSMFATIAAEMIEHICDLQDRESDGKVSHICLKVLSNWRELLAKIRQEHSQNEVSGLYGELSVLERLLSSNPACISLWQGPYGSVRDFIGRDTELEVKTTQTKHGKRVRINGETQLSMPRNEKLLLAVVQLEQQPLQGTSLRDKFAKVQSICLQEADLLKAIISAGFDPYDLPEEPKFREFGFSVFLVCDQFPKITPASFKGSKIPLGIVEIDYTIDLTNVAQLDDFSVETELAALSMSASK